MRISDWSSDVCSSDLVAVELVGDRVGKGVEGGVDDIGGNADRRPAPARAVGALDHHAGHGVGAGRAFRRRSEEHTSELQSLMRISYAVFCLKTKNKNTDIHIPDIIHTRDT